MKNVIILDNNFLKDFVNLCSSGASSRSLLGNNDTGGFFILTSTFSEF